MNFPIKYRLRNLSEALQDSLRDKGIIDSSTNRTRQRYFELPIKSGPLLESLFEFFELEGDFHVGCTSALRPPNFSFSTTKGKYDTRQGVFSLSYTRRLKLSVFLKNYSFRNEHNVRNLDALAEAYNESENCTEDIGISWHGWTGEKLKNSLGLRNFPTGKEPYTKFGFSGARISLEFDGEHFLGLEGIEHLSKTGRGVGGPRYGDHTPFFGMAEGTTLTGLVQQYELLEQAPNDFAYAHKLAKLELSIEKLLLELIQIGYKIFPQKSSPDLNDSLLEKIRSTYKFAPEGFDRYCETKLFFDLGGEINYTSNIHNQNTSALNNPKPFQHLH